ncbi:MAG: twin-arginine translocase subunit TatC, partial [Acidobacteriota bacterium]|nr:twin-arginine translocase subunit TatC [Acidobacteriota bacterium]
MASTLLKGRARRDGPAEDRESLPGGQMSFLEHLDELRKRLIRSVAFVFIAFFACWWVSDYIYNFLARPVRVALADAQRRQLPLGGLTGNEAVLPLNTAKEGDTGRYVFSQTTKLGQSVIPVGA